MTLLAAAVADFLAQRPIAVAGVSRRAAEHSGNAVYKRLRDRGYEVFALNPNADTSRATSAFTTLRRSPAASMPSSLRPTRRTPRP